MEVSINMKEKIEQITIYFVAILLVFVTLLLIILMTYIVDNSFKDHETILAGCIGFIGAIIGGFITLFGVNKTIHENRRLDIAKTLPVRIVETQNIINKFKDRANFLNIDKRRF